MVVATRRVIVNGQPLDNISLNGIAASADATDTTPPTTIFATDRAASLRCRDSSAACRARRPPSAAIKRLYAPRTWISPACGEIGGSIRVERAAEDFAECGTATWFFAELSNLGRSPMMGKNS